MDVPAQIAQDEIERDIDACIEACGGDVRATIRALMIANVFLEEELSRLTSSGYTRKRQRSG